MYILVLLFVANDAWIYKTPIAKITHVKEEQTASRKAVRGRKKNSIINRLWKPEY